MDSLEAWKNFFFLKRIEQRFLSRLPSLQPSQYEILAPHWKLLRTRKTTRITYDMYKTRGFLDHKFPKFNLEISVYTTCKIKTNLFETSPKRALLKHQPL
jgi:hypothetical protein